MIATALGQKIARRIRAEGPLAVAAYMAMALHDPEGGYYARRELIGAQGDFITAPEISQVFGELIGLWCAVVWDQLGRPDPVVLAELGPGRGVMIADLLRTVAKMPDFRRALRLYLLETSASLRAEQERRLAKFGPVWVSRLDDLPERPLLVVANEFLDALPVRQFVRRGTGWSERMVTLDHKDRLVFVEGPAGAIASMLVPPVLRDSALEGDVVEISPAALAVAADVGARLSRQTGAALFVDYGYFPSALGTTLRALHQHRAVSVLAAPGTADISAHVDFAAVAEAARAGGAEIHGPVPQACLLVKLGARERAAALRETATPSQRRTLDSGVERLLDCNGMGTLFKAIALVSPGLPTPPGFDTTL